MKIEMNPKTSFRSVVTIILIAVAVATGVYLVFVSGGDGSVKQAPTPTPTRDVNTDHETIPGNQLTIIPTVDDYSIALKILRKQCFGEAGCNISYRVDLKYVGPTPSYSGNLTVYYQVDGDDSGPILDTIEATQDANGQGTFRAYDGSASTDGGGLTAKILMVEPTR